MKVSELTGAALDWAVGVSEGREQFEVDCISKGLPFIDRCTEPGYEHQYTNPIYQARWEGWQASREALVVKLPDPIEVQDTGDFMCCVIDELERLGVRYE